MSLRDLQNRRHDLARHIGVSVATRHRIDTDPTYGAERGERADQLRSRNLLMAIEEYIALEQEIELAESVTEPFELTTELDAAEAAYQNHGNAWESVWPWLRKYAGSYKTPAARIINLVDIRRATDELLALEVRRLRALGWTWSRVGLWAKMSKQAAQQKWG